MDAVCVVGEQAMQTEAWILGCGDVGREATGCVASRTSEEVPYLRAIRQQLHHCSDPEELFIFGDGDGVGLG